MGYAHPKRKAITTDLKYVNKRIYEGKLEWEVRKMKWQELIADMIVWSQERTPTITKEFCDELRRNAKVRDVDVEPIIKKVEEWTKE